MWHKWNVNANDVMMTWFALYANLVTTCLACVMHTHVHDACALCKTSTSKNFSGLACKQADLNLAKRTTSHFWVLNTQNANENMPNMILIANRNENFTKCNENLAWGKREPLIHPYMFWYKMKGDKASDHNF